MTHRRPAIPSSGVATSPDYSFALRPIWLIGHLIALGAVVGFVILGFWQLSRHDDRAQLDAALEARLTMEPASLDALQQEAGQGSSTIEYRPVRVTGTYLIDEEVILQARSLDGRSGHEVLTPLLLDDGGAVVVDRGWVPIDVVGPPVVGAEPPASRVEVTGYVRLPQLRRGLGPVDPAEGELDRISRVDIARLQAQIDTPLREVWIQLSAQAPPQVELPLVVDPPQPGGGPPHLAYAVQWFAFAGIVVAAYPILLRRNARRSHEPGQGRSGDPR